MFLVRSDRGYRREELLYEKECSGRAKGIKLLVILKENETSTPSQLFPGLVKDPAVFEGVGPAPDDRHADCLYRVRNPQSPAR